MRNAGLDEAQAVIKIAGRNINNLRYADNTTLIAEGASLLAQMVKCLPAMWETWVQSLSWEDLLEKEMATHSSSLAWKIPWTEEPGRLQSMGSQRVGHDLVTLLHLTYGRKWRTKEPLDESEIGEWKNWRKTQHRKLRLWHPVQSLHGK